ncbi:opioid-binding protein/cell adhesion molecule homolog isoform X1 [Macrobrachium rosenbergii]|uniref:opioid-binding protein/cell adhesion molecule homolog isoform X1 n=1 Tax=Macrobrachium rosenbergii TaxID=79674 RepID=UPI0034D5BFD6
MSELLTEGSDLFLECIVDSNPPPYKIEFFQNGVALNPNTSGTTILKEATLAIQHVTREHSGDYHCKASNVQGDSSSKNISVHVRYVPICAVNESVVGAQVGETVSLTCVVFAYPGDVNFTWMFISDARDEEGGGGGSVGGSGGGGGGGGSVGGPVGGGGGIPRIIDALQYTCDGLSSTLHLTPKSPRDFGVFSCYGTNKNGIQQQPCTFALVPAGPPEESGNCSIAKVSSRQITVSCHPGKFHGGRLQQFIHQVRLASTGELVLNKSSSEASVELSSLEPDSQYIVSVTPIDPRGNAPAPRNFHIQTHRSQDAYKPTLAAQTKEVPLDNGHRPGHRPDRGGSSSGPVVGPG